MFYNGCVLRYSNENYFSRLSEQPSINLLGGVKSKVNQSQFIDIVTGLLDDLVVEAVTNSSISPSLYATRSANYTRFDDVYAMVQCTPDLTPSLCNRCLRSAVGRLSTCCSEVQGARVLFPSRTFRFEYAPFHGNYMHATPTIGASPPILQPPSNTTNNYMDQDIQSAESLQFNFNMISDATNNFAEANKLGEGGFGPVYKGTLSDGQEIAVKRLSKSSGQGDQEFKNEVLLLAKLQHRNLARLLGFCLHEQEKLLVYELMNASLDHFIFVQLLDMNVCRYCEWTYILDWEIRYKIVGAIARGLLYLHEDSRVRIIHRDLKASNILLAENMTPKISDFGLARLFVVDQTQANTIRIAGTLGYMAPEYALHGRFSVKSDVFSFGVLVLEILSGKKNTSFYESIAGGAQDLLTYAWRHWQDGSAMELLDPSLNENCSTLPYYLFKTVLQIDRQWTRLF
ncbi:cysteine-rich receptor-like protein kinase 10 [Papaver somniferum]|uniref:cysteine-rich receptor-like protein kinase 10 n=1 Tax=Papaver somniferum TaxID=3469 RepID=UPI000E7011E5|nr:cysteine-rich receptor-like protein kinase 10 [Papaver somniferum]